MFIRRIYIVVFLGLLLLAAKSGESFKESQLQNKRVRNAFDEKATKIADMLSNMGVNPNSYEIYIRAFKTEEELEVWARSKGKSRFHLIETYQFCENVGFVGPKRRQGDGQIPEGMYKLSAFNPFSNYHLSLKVSYPNLADRKREGNYDLGGQIFIHGGCQTIGCIPITDDKIKELYLMAVQAKNAGQHKIDCHIFPNRLTRERFRSLIETSKDKELARFWGNLRTCIVYFNRYRFPPSVTVHSDGYYIYNHPY